MRNLNIYFLSRLISNIKERLSTDDELVISRRNLTGSNYSNGVVGNLVGGNFLTGLLLLLNADDAFMGLITMVGLIGNLIQVTSPLFLERFESRKKILILGRGLIHFFNIIVIGLMPYLPGQNKLKLSMVITVVLLINLINALTSPGFVVWHIKSIPENIRARYFSFFSISNGIIIYSILLIASKFVDYFKASGRELDGLIILRIIALAISFADIFFLFGIKEFPNIKSETKLNLKTVLIYPFKERKYLITVLITCLWSISANIPGPYFTVYLLKDLKVDYSYLNIINMLNIPILVLATPVWKRIIENTSWFKTLNYIVAIYIVHYIGLAFVGMKTLFLFPVFMVYAFILLAAINLIFSNMPYINIPEGNQTNFIGFYSTMNTLAALIGVTIGKEFIARTQGINLSIFGFEMLNKQYILLLASAVMLLSSLAITFLRRKAEKMETAD